ncbi:hypothetical protein ACSQ6I_02570 [Anabaena sp. WFMT]|uniref:hypothetical protein n=1 Tax=Anabaena sp. WFMT TaxID=3449730 RepID=UPI003F24811C
MGNSFSIHQSPFPHMPNGRLPPTPITKNQPPAAKVAMMITESKMPGVSSVANTSRS